MRWLGFSHTLWHPHNYPLPHHHLVLFEGEWTRFSAQWEAWRAETAISLVAYLNVNRACAVVFLCCCCRLFRSMSAQSSSDWAALQTGRLKDQVDTPSIKLFFLLKKSMHWGNLWLEKDFFFFFFSHWKFMMFFPLFIPQEFSLFCRALIPSWKWICEQFHLTSHHKR